MWQLKLHKQFYFFTLLVSLISFSGVANTIPVEKTTVEVIHIKTPDQHKIYGFNDGLTNSKEREKQFYSIFNFDCLLNLEHQLQVSNYNTFIGKYIPLHQVKLFLKSQDYSSFMDFVSIV
jgi:hypothetical protein